MENQIAVPGSVAAAFPELVKQLRKASEILEGIESFEDIENVFLRGRGLSPATYRVYAVAVRQFYEFTGGLHPFQAKPHHIESWFDSLVKKIDRNTAVLRIRGLKKFFEGVAEECPFFISPFKCRNGILQGGGRHE